MAQKTTDHERIKNWAEQRGGRPAVGEGLQIDFAGEQEPISWDEFFQRLDQEHMAMEFEDRTPTGQLSKYCRFVEA